jgi:hypothetical protein
MEENYGDEGRGLTDPRGDASSLRRTARRSSDAAIDGWSRALSCGSKGGCGCGEGLEDDASRDVRGKGVAAGWF